MTTPPTPEQIHAAMQARWPHLERWAPEVTEGLEPAMRDMTQEWWTALHPLIAADTLTTVLRLAEASHDTHAAHADDTSRAKADALWALILDLRDLRRKRPTP